MNTIRHQTVFIVAFVSALIATALSDVAVAQPNKPVIPGQVCSSSELTRIGGAYPRAPEVCLTQGRAMFCAVDGTFKCCNQTTGACTSSQPISPAAAMPRASALPSLRGEVGKDANGVVIRK
jgi:hypothetical protein